MNHKHKLINTALTMGAVLLLVSSCSKEAETTSGNPEYFIPNEPKVVTDKETRERINELSENMPTLAVYNHVHGDYIFLDLNNPKTGFSFTDPGFTGSFTTPDGGGSFVTGPDGTTFIVVSPGTSSGNGGGTVGAGSATLDLNFVFCFSADEESLGGGLFDFGGSDVDGFSGAVGVSGDFDALMNGEIDENSNPFEYFFGMAAYYVLDDNPSGTYNVLNFFDEEGFEDEDEFAIAILASFGDGGGFYFSSGGQLDFQSSSVGFEGTYLGLENFLFTGDDEIDLDANYVEVPGYGYINCGQ